MWYLAQEIDRGEFDHASTMREALQSTIHNLILLSGLFFLIATMIVSTGWEGTSILGLMACILILGVSFFLADYLLKYSTLLGLMVWLASFVLTVLAGSWFMQAPGLVLLCAVLPLIAAITISAWAGLAAEGVVIGILLLVNRPAFGGPLPANEMSLIIGCAAFLGLLGYTVSRELLNLSLWSMSNFDRARQKLDEVRDRQLELNQTQEDLRQANSELVRLSKRLKALEQIAEEARQATAEFVANVSHELRTPLNMIIGYADMISRSPKVYGGRLPASLMTDITAILRNAQHLSNLVNDVLDLSQVEAGRMAVCRSWVSLPETITEALAAVQGLFDSKGLYLTSEVEPNLPLVYYDEVRIRQVIINLLSNAGRFTEQGGVTLHCEPVGNQVVIRVGDTGPGIAKKDQERIFEPFQQADTSIRRKYGGSGLGLTISKQFIEMHGGNMWLESEPGEGTSFSFSLPLKSSSGSLEDETGRRVMRAIIPDDEVGYRLRTRRSHFSPTPAPERYVVVDQEQTLQRLLKRYVPDAKVEIVDSLPAAVQALNRSPAQALVLNAPWQSGDGAPPVPSLPYGTPAITCWLPGKREAANRLGVVEYLMKPIARERLLAALKNLAQPVKTILIVDDEEDELYLFARYLEAEEHGYSTLQVTNGRRALSMLRSRRPDVMLLDLIMPGMDGFQVLEEKRKDSSICDIPVIVISSRDPEGDPILSDSFSVAQSGGLSQRSLIACIQALGEILAPSTVKENP